MSKARSPRLVLSITTCMAGAYQQFQQLAATRGGPACEGRQQGTSHRDHVAPGLLQLRRGSHFNVVETQSGPTEGHPLCCQHGSPLECTRCAVKRWIATE